MRVLPTLQILARILSPVEGDLSPLVADPPDWETLVAVSSRHMVTPALTPAFKTKGVFETLPEDLKQYLAYIHSLNTERNASLKRQAIALARSLNGAGIVPVMLKGMAYLFSNLHGDPGARVVGDIDLFITGDRLSETQNILANMGYTPLYEEDPSGPREHHHVPPVRKEEEPAVVEVHTHPIKLDFASLLSLTDFLKGIITLDIEGVKIGIPSSTHQAIICIEHEGLANRDDDFLRISLRGLHDLSCLFLRNDVAWPHVLTRFKTAGLARTANHYAALVRYFFSISPRNGKAEKHLPLFLKMALGIPRTRTPLVILSLAGRCLTDGRIRKTALDHAKKVIRGEESLDPFRKQMADRD